MEPADVEVTAFGVRQGRAEVTFGDGTRLVLVPEQKEGAIVGIRVAALERDGQVRAAAGMVGGGSWFWTAGEATQEDLAGHLAAAIEEERTAYRLYRRRRIDEADWQARFRPFWQVTIKARPLREALAAGRLPLRDHPPDLGPERP